MCGNTTSFFSGTFSLTSSTGEMPKFWDSAHEYLYKADRTDIYYDVYSEIICSRLAGILGLSHVVYTLVTIEGREYCKCKNFLKQDEILTTAADLQKYSNYSDANAISLIRAANPYEFDQMLLFDFLVVNTDRHHNNFGIIKDIDTGNTRLTPLFDHNAALYSDRLNNTGSPFSSIDYWLIEKMYHNGMGKLPERVKQNEPTLHIDDYFNAITRQSLVEIFIQLPRMPDERKQSLLEMLWMRYKYLKELL